MATKTLTLSESISAVEASQSAYAKLAGQTAADGAAAEVQAGKAAAAAAVVLDDGVTQTAGAVAANADLDALIASIETARIVVDPPPPLAGA